jgi:hypothetical protein
MTDKKFETRIHNVSNDVLQTYISILDEKTDKGAERIAKIKSLIRERKINKILKS